MEHQQNVPKEARIAAIASRKNERNRFAGKNSRPDKAGSYECSRKPATVAPTTSLVTPDGFVVPFVAGRSKLDWESRRFITLL
jgi:hypothetical protein